MKPTYHETTRKVEWKRSRVTKETRIARKDANEATRTHYAHRHVLETTYDTLIGTVEVKIDLDSIIIDMAMKAARNTSGRATMYGGAIKAKRLTQNVIATYAVPTPIPEGYSIVDLWDALLDRDDLLQDVLRRLYNEDGGLDDIDREGIIAAIVALEELADKVEKSEKEERPQ